MTEELAAGFRSRPDFREQDSGRFGVGGVDFQAQVTIEEDTVVLVQGLPTLDATVEGEAVAPVVESGWEETFERRVQDVTGVIGDLAAGPTVTRDGETIHVRMELEDDGVILPEAVRHAVDFVESTWVEGIIPGYDYDERVKRIRNRAMQTGESGN